MIRSKQKCASSAAKTSFRIQELQLLVGLANTLQCKDQEAVRIALYEMAASGVLVHRIITSHKRSRPNGWVCLETEFW